MYSDISKISEKSPMLIYNNNNNNNNMNSNVIEKAKKIKKIKTISKENTKNIQIQVDAHTNTNTSNSQSQSIPVSIPVSESEIMNNIEEDMKNEVNKVPNKEDMVVNNEVDGNCTNSMEETKIVTVKAITMEIMESNKNKDIL